MSEQPSAGVNVITKGSRPGLLSFTLMGVAFSAFIIFIIVN
jgi:hypothetical protein